MSKNNQSEQIEDLSNRIERIEKWYKGTTIVANIFIILQVFLILIAYLQLTENKRFNNEQIAIVQEQELTKLAIDAIGRTFDPKFIDSFAIIKDKNAEKDSNRYIEAFNIVLNTYYSLSIIYNKEIASTSIIENGIYIELDKFVNLADFKVYKNTEIGKNILKMHAKIHSKKSIL